jgi:hypothetical protein
LKRIIGQRKKIKFQKNVFYLTIKPFPQKSYLKQAKIAGNTLDEFRKPE